ncbi:hypothetical protein RFI_36751 [Reticulomyxa filosa]|uniref:Uncharacterized protein n=1 Tax=Reticulomyxa filosa TaxID=46433 RepID=X6LGH4_RETFI|nr:hypothetical protein RFI_36751 [Reticulomyxa filosa]|eukprot:ETO00689.1 hypothetical protein RFI_36751 [Reticulomyxa filosa]
MKKRLLHDIVYLEKNDIFGLRRFSGDYVYDTYQKCFAEKGSSGHVKKVSDGNVSQEEENDGNSSDENMWAQACAQQEIWSSSAQKSFKKKIITAISFVILLNFGVT